MPPMRMIGDQHPLREWRARQGVSLRAFVRLLERAKGAGFVSYASLSRIENGQQPPSGDLMLGIFEVTNGEITPNDLLGVDAA